VKTRKSINLFRLLSFILILFSLNPVSAQPRFWPFGQGLALDFNQNPAVVDTIPWQRSFPYLEADVNETSVFTDDSNNLRLYFLNGTYYDSLKNPIYRVDNYFKGITPRVTAGFNAGTGVDHCSRFFSRGDTILHLFTSAKTSFDSVNPNLPALAWTKETKIFFSQLTKQNGNWQVQVIDSFPRVYSNSQANQVQLNSVFRTIDLGEGLPKYVLHSMASVNVRGFTRPYSALKLTSQGFQVLNVSADSSDYQNIIYRGSFSPLLNKIVAVKIPLRINWQLNSRYEYLVYYNYQDQNGTFSISPVDSFRLTSPADSSSWADIRWTATSLVKKNFTGRYLFVNTISNETAFLNPGIFTFSHNRIIRYDLFARNQQEFEDLTVDLGWLDELVLDMQMGPDGHLYILRNGDNASNWIQMRDRFNNAQNNVLARILNADSADPSYFQTQGNFYTALPWQAYTMFPSFSSSQLVRAPFFMGNYCADSTTFTFNYKAIGDSVSWDFGEPALGAANHSSAFNPTVVYPSSGGSYYVRLEIWWRGTFIRSMGDSVHIKPIVNFDLPRDTILCSGDSLRLDVSQNFEVNYLWNTGDTLSELVVREPGWYKVTVSNSCGAKTDSILVGFINSAKPFLQDTLICAEDTSALIAAPAIENGFYQWSTGDTAREIKAPATGNYRLSWGNRCDTIYEEFFLDRASCACEIYLPNAFSPNGDGLNDTYVFGSSCDQLEFTLLIFNRWGGLVYQQEANDPPWDGSYNGQKAPAGIYIYRLIFRGESHQKNLEGKRSGSISLMR
jgi:gliding motility-associated-like protein